MAIGYAGSSGWPAQIHLPGTPAGDGGEDRPPGGVRDQAKDGQRHIQLDLSTPGRQAPLLLFDAADPANLGWFSRCQFYVDGRTGAVMQTPLTLANRRDRGGKAQSQLGAAIDISKELPASFRLPGKQPLTEQVFYSLLFTFLTALIKTGVAVCGTGVVQPLAGRRGRRPAQLMLYPVKHSGPSNCC